jgi:hypothetical protein
VTHAQNLFRRSLKKEEKDLLDSIERHGPIAEEEHCDSRKELRKFLEGNRGSLPANEVDYLLKLIACPNVSSEIVERARKSVHPGSLHQPVGTSVTEEQERPRLVQRLRDASFRKEVWTVSNRSLEESKEADQKKEQNID